MADIDLMVLPARVIEDPPRFLHYTGGLWRDLGSAAKVEDLSQLQVKIDDQLRLDMETLEPAGGAIATGPYFSLLYDLIFPEPLRLLLENSEPAHAGDPPPILRLHLDTAVDWIPWEMAFDGAAFLGLRFRVVRLPIVRTGTDLNAVKDPWPVTKIYSFLGEWVLDASQLASWEQTFPVGGVASVSEQRLPGGGASNFPIVADVEQAAGDGHIVHFTCHGGIKNAGAAGGTIWTLNHKKATHPHYKIDGLIVSAFKKKLPLTRPLVFGNACGSSGQAAGMGGLVDSFGARFIQAGASAFVGTCAPIAKVRAIEFASRFYKYLLVDGLPVSTALWRAKQELTTPTDPSPLLYCQYGSPGSRYTIG